MVAEINSKESSLALEWVKLTPGTMNCVFSRRLICQILIGYTEHKELQEQLISSLLHRYENSSRFGSNRSLNSILPIQCPVCYQSPKPDDNIEPLHPPYSFSWLKVLRCQLQLVGN